MTHVPDRPLNPPELESNPGYDYWLCAGCGQKQSRDEIARLICKNDGEVTSDEHKCRYCIEEEMADLFENEQEIIINRDLCEPDGFEEIDEATAEGY